jgi:hypothetical protein
MGSTDNLPIPLSIPCCCLLPRQPGELHQRVLDLLGGRLRHSYQQQVARVEGISVSVDEYSGILLITFGYIWAVGVHHA